MNWRGRIGAAMSFPARKQAKKIKYTNMDNLDEVMEINREKRSHFIKEEILGETK